MGFSLGGASVWKLLTAPGGGTRLAAAVPIMTWTSLYDALAPQGFAKAGLVASIRGLLPDERWDATVRALADDALYNRNLPGIQEFARVRSVRNDLEKIRTPVFMIHGRRDDAFDMDQALSAFGRLKGPKRLYLGDLGHAPAANPASERGYYLTQARLWFDRFLKGHLNGVDTRPKLELAPDPWIGRTTQYPTAARATRARLVRAREIEEKVVERLRFRGTKTIDANGKAVRIVAPTRRLNETFGTPLAAIKASSTTRWPHLVAVLSALTPHGEEIVVSQGGAHTPTLSARRRLITVRLSSQATTIPRGSRFRLTIAAASTLQHQDNQLYPAAAPTTARVTIGEAKIVLPILRQPISR